LVLLAAMAVTIAAAQTQDKKATTTEQPASLLARLAGTISGYLVDVP
jgi:hypothetical protein